ncbi:MAG TPA: endolytic transglycosylase MltG, partial [Stellaceae bacterium]
MTWTSRRLCRGATLVLGVLLLAILGWGWRSYTAPGPLAESKVVVVQHGATLRGVARELAESGVIAQPWIFMAGLELEGRAGTLKAGEYEFAAAISPRAVGELLASG